MKASVASLVTYKSNGGILHKPEDSDKFETQRHESGEERRRGDFNVVILSTSADITCYLPKMDVPPFSASKSILPPLYVAAAHQIVSLL